jgi:hypothetical protein
VAEHSHSRHLPFWVLDRLCRLVRTKVLPLKALKATHFPSKQNTMRISWWLWWHSRNIYKGRITLSFPRPPSATRSAVTRAKGRPPFNDYVFAPKIQRQIAVVLILIDCIQGGYVSAILSSWLHWYAFAPKVNEGATVVPPCLIAFKGGCIGRFGPLGVSLTWLVRVCAETQRRSHHYAHLD